MGLLVGKGGRKGPPTFLGEPGGSSPSAAEVREREAAIAGEVAGGVDIGGRPSGPIRSR